MNTVFLDTHTTLWLHDNKLKRFSSYALSLIDQAHIYYSAMTGLELQYLHEIKRSKYSPEAILQHLNVDIGLQIAESPFHLVVQYAVQNTWTRDPFDRIIVADAQYHNAPLITADIHIQKHYKKALI